MLFRSRLTASLLKLAVTVGPLQEGRVVVRGHGGILPRKGCDGQRGGMLFFAVVFPLTPGAGFDILRDLPFSCDHMLRYMLVH